MATLKLVKPERVLLKSHPEFTERWLQEQIAADPSILGLGSVVVKDKERSQPRAGRLDLLLQDVDTARRYEVELQLGPTDESHLIRTLEYWDIERRRYPQYDHCAVIVAEEITARFLNVISLFNGHIPLIALQLSALKINDNIALVCTRVLDELPLGLVDEDEEVRETTDRAYWEDRSSKDILGIADELLKDLRQLDQSLEFKYNKFYIGLARDGEPDNVVVFRAKRSFVIVEPRLAESTELTARLEASGVDLMDYDKKWNRYRIRVSKPDLVKHRQLLAEIIKLAYEQR